MSQQSKISEIVEHHLTKEKVIFRIKDEKEMFVIKSLMRKNESYFVIKENDKWDCDCKSFKFKTGTDANGNCKHILVIQILMQEGIEIEYA